MVRAPRVGALGVVWLVSTSLVANADLPVHCMGDEFLGEWDLKLTAPSMRDFYQVDKCGHEQPNNWKTAVHVNDGYDNWWYDRLSQDAKQGIEVSTFRLCVPLANMTGAKICDTSNSSGENICAQEEGCSPVKFTMLYDEGFIVSAHPFKEKEEKEVHIKLLGFFKYRPKKQGGELPSLESLTEFVSFCDETITGFWTTKGSEILDIHQKTNKYYRGCFVGKKTTRVEAHPSEMRKQYRPETGPVVSPNALLETHSSFRQSIRQGSFLAGNLQVSQKAIDTLNAANLGWQASAESFQAMGKTYEEAMNKLGVFSEGIAANRISAYHQAFLQLSSDSFSLSSALHDIQEKDASFQLLSDGEKAEYANETKCALQSLGDSDGNFDWSDPSTTGCPGVVPETLDQGSCGSCYAFACSRAMTMRYRIFNHPDDKCRAVEPGRVPSPQALQVDLSPQSVLDCSYANEGCSGGYPGICAFHAYAHGLYDSTCDPYTAESSPCKSSLPTSCARVFADDFSYAGGPYGYGTSMHAMMLDIVTSGPLAIGMDATPELGFYHSGVYRPMSRPEQSLSMKHSTWSKTTHAVTLVGWRTINGELVWKVQNSWGKRWGHEGYFYLPAGKGLVAIETMPMSVRFGEGKPMTRIGKQRVEAYERCLRDN